MRTPAILEQVAEPVIATDTDAHAEDGGDRLDRVQQCTKRTMRTRGNETTKTVAVCDSQRR